MLHHFCGAGRVVKKGDVVPVERGIGEVAVVRVSVLESQSKTLT